jgi:tetrahydromethanopterin S-methyltransferase subunit F
MSYSEEGSQQSGLAFGVYIVIIVAIAIGLVSALILMANGIK